jgi:hypothetical protein
MNFSIQRSATLATPLIIAAIAFTLAGSVHAADQKAPVHGSFHSAKDPDLPPLPFNPHPELEVVEVEKGVYIVDDTGIPDTPEQAAARQARQAERDRAAAIASNPLLAQATQAAQQAAQEAAWAQNREQFLPWLHPNGLTEGGEPISESFESWQSNAVPALLQLGEELGTMQAEQLTAATNFAYENGWPLVITNDDGSSAVLVRVESGRPMYLGAYNLNAADTLGSDELWTNGNSGLNLNGDGTQVAMWDDGDPRVAHREFTTNSTRAFIMDGPSSRGTNNHPTHVAGTLGAYGVTNAAKGMANRAVVLANDFISDYAEMATEFATNQFRLSNHSYGLATIGWYGIGNYLGTNYPQWYGDHYVSATEDWYFGIYDAGSSNLDRVVYASRYYLPVRAAGNERGPAGKPAISQANGHLAFYQGVNYYFPPSYQRPDDGGTSGYDCLPPDAVSKNCLTVGAVSNIIGGYSGSNSVGMSTFSSFGPADDGRIKPDVVGDGVNLYSTGAASNSHYYADSGTSMASPNVCGSLNLLVQLHNRYVGTNQPMLSSTLRGLAIHTADEAGTNAGPDYRFGWGLVNALKAARLITNNFASGSIPFIKEVKVPNGDSVEFSPVAKGGEPLVVTICWTDPAGTPVYALAPTNRMLVNDFDLRVTRSGVTNFPYKLNPASPASAATTGDNDTDNVEQVVVVNPVTNGVYTVRVTHKGTLKDDTGATAAQWISIFVSGNVRQAEPALLIEKIARTVGSAVAMQWPANVGRVYQVQSRAAVDSGTWTAATGEISATRTNVAVEVSMSGDTRFYRVARVR